MVNKADADVNYYANVNKNIKHTSYLPTTKCQYQ